MAAYKTGRSRDIVVSGEIGGRVKKGPLPGTSQAWFVASLAALGCTWSIQHATPYRREISVTCTGDSDSDVDTSTITDSTLSGEYSITVPVEEWVEITEGGAPTYGGSAVDGDVPPETTITFTERLRVGASVTASLTLNGRTAMASDTITDATIITEYSASGELLAWGMSRPPGGTAVVQTATLTVDYLLASMPLLSISTDYVTTQTTGASSSVRTLDAEEEVADWHSGSVQFAVTPPQGFDLSGQLMADTRAYSGGGIVRVKRKAGESYTEVAVSDGAYTCAYGQSQYSATVTADAYSTSDSVSEFTSPIYHWLVPTSGEQSDQWRLLLRGPYYLAGTILQAATVALDGGFSFGGSGTTRTFSPEKSLAGYRYLLVQTDQADKQVTLTIGVKSWTARTAGTGLAIFDLCVPANLATATDARDSRWPVPTAVDTVTGDGAMWGVVNVGSYTLAAEAGVTCAVGSNGVYLSRDTWASPPAGHSLLNVVSPHLYWVPSGVAGEQKRPFLRGDTDGRRSLDEADYTDASGSYTAETIGWLFSAVNAVDSGVTRNPGWTATLNPAIDVADGADGDNWFYGLLNKNRNATWLEGAGLSYRDGNWEYGLDLDVSAARDLYAQLLCDKVTIYPACGDVFGLRTGAHRWEYGDDADEARAELRGGRYMRGVSWGLVFLPDSTPADGITVTQREQDVVPSGDGKTDQRGEYLTGAPAGAAGLVHRIQPQTDASAPYADRIQYGGLRLRTCFGVAITDTDWISYDVCKPGRHVRAYTTGGKLVLGFSNDPKGVSWSEVVTTIDAKHPCVRWDKMDHYLRAMVLFDNGTSVFKTWTRDDGGSFADVATLATGEYPTMCVSADGKHLFYWYDAGAIKGLWQNSLGDTVYGPFTVVASGVDADAIAVEDFAVQPNTWAVNLLYRSSGNIVVRTSYDGVTFT